MIPICFITPNNFAHKAGDGLSTRHHNVSEIHPAIVANTGGTQMTYILVADLNYNFSDRKLSLWN